MNTHKGAHEKEMGDATNSGHRAVSGRKTCYFRAKVFNYWCETFQQTASRLDEKKQHGRNCAVSKWINSHQPGFTGDCIEIRSPMTNTVYQP